MLGSVCTGVGELGRLRAAECVLGRVCSGEGVYWEGCVLEGVCTARLCAWEGVCWGGCVVEMVCTEEGVH